MMLASYLNYLFIHLFNSMYILIITWYYVKFMFSVGEGPAFHGGELGNLKFFGEVEEFQGGNLALRNTMPAHKIFVCWPVINFILILLFWFYPFKYVELIISFYITHIRFSLLLYKIAL